MSAWGTQALVYLKWWLKACLCTFGLQLFFFFPGSDGISVSKGESESFLPGQQAWEGAEL